MAIVISGVNNNDKITASDGTIDLLSGVNYSSEVEVPSLKVGNNIQFGNAGIVTATSFAGNFSGTTGTFGDFVNIGSNIQLGNAGVVTATTFTGNLTGNVNATSNLLFQIGGSEKARIDSSGRIGINVTPGCADGIFNVNVDGTNIFHLGHGTNKDNYFTCGASGMQVFRAAGTERLRIDSSGRLLLGTTTEGAADADDLTISTSGNTGITIRSGTTHNGSIYFSDTTSGIGEYAGQIDYDHNNNSLNFYADNDQCLRLLNNKSVSVSEKLVLENGTVFLNKHSVGVGTTTQTGRNAGVSTATGTIIYNAETEKVQVYANATWRNVGSLEPEYGTGYYSSLSAAQAAGLSHYWPGNSSTALISGLQPDDRKGNPTFNNKEHDGYGATYPFFHFAGQTGGDNPTGYRFTHSADWVGHSFAITYWVKVMQEVTEGESTYVQLGDHSGLRSMFAMSSSGNTNLRGKTITIGSDNSNDQIQYEFANWIHVGVRYNYGTNAARYFKNGVATETHTFAGGSLSVGTGNNHIYLGYGYWNSSTSNKESCSRMSDIGIWDSTDLNDSIMTDIYRAGRIVKGY